jgi:hypothetical protein
MVCSDEKRSDLNKKTMTEETKQLLETEKTIERLYEDGKIEIGAYTILIDRNKQAINYSRCSAELKCGDCDCVIKYPDIGCDSIKDCKKTH